MIVDFEERLCKAHCCAVQLADEYVRAKSKGRTTEQDLYILILFDQYLDTLDRYKKSLPLVDQCSCCHHHEGSCITELQAQFILDQITTLCGACSCNC